MNEKISVLISKLRGYYQDELSEQGDEDIVVQLLDEQIDRVDELSAHVEELIREEGICQKS
jgi:hypothetical protein